MYYFELHWATVTLLCLACFLAGGFCAMPSGPSEN